MAYSRANIEGDEIGKNAERRAGERSNRPTPPTRMPAQIAGHEPMQPQPFRFAKCDQAVDLLIPCGLQCCLDRDAGQATLMRDQANARSYGSRRCCFLHRNPLGSPGERARCVARFAPSPARRKSAARRRHRDRLGANTGGSDFADAQPNSRFSPRLHNVSSQPSLPFLGEVGDAKCIRH